MINLHELLEINESEFYNYKVHFATSSHDKKKPYNVFLLGEFKNWQEYQKNKNFKRKFIISLIYYEKDIWLFGGIYEVLSCSPSPLENSSKWKYETTLTEKGTDYIGRAFFKFKKEFRASYPALELVSQTKKAVAQMALSHLLEKRVGLSDFLGFDKVNIDYEMLEHIVKENIFSWKSALSKVKGIYLIVDSSSGKQYVGSAYGTDCIWQRWSNYAKNGHGGNIELKELLKVNGDKYKYNFKFSILEVCNMNLGNDYIIERETHWKEILLSQKFGLNKN